MRTFAPLFLILCALTNSCTTYKPVAVIVSNADDVPIEGASVHAAPMYFFNPTSKNYIIIGPYDILEPFPAKGDGGTTGGDGSVLLEIVTDSPLELNVLAENQFPWKGQIVITKQGDVEINPYPNKSLMKVTSP